VPEGVEGERQAEIAGVREGDRGQEGPDPQAEQLEGKPAQDREQHDRGAGRRRDREEGVEGQLRGLEGADDEAWRRHVRDEGGELLRIEAAAEARPREADRDGDEDRDDDREDDGEHRGGASWVAHPGLYRFPPGTARARAPRSMSGAKCMHISRRKPGAAKRA
jgi:hypothetical protein